MNMQLRFSLGMMPLKYRMQIQYVPALPCISPAEPIPGELLLSRAHFRFDSNTKFKRKNYIYKLSKKATTYKYLLKHKLRKPCFNSIFDDQVYLSFEGDRFSNYLKFS